MLVSMKTKPAMKARTLAELIMNFSNVYGIRKAKAVLRLAVKTDLAAACLGHRRVSGKGNREA